MRLRAPRNDGEVLAVPPLGEIVGVLEANRTVIAAADHVDVHGRTLGELRRWSRDECLRLAREYTHALTGTKVEVPAAGPWFVSGHQPALVHPGVWAKHFAIASLAARHSGLGLNLVVDNDLLASTALPVPRGTRETPTIERVPWFPPQPPRPWEEAAVEDETAFERFGETVGRIVEDDWGYHPLIADVWRDAVAARATLPGLADHLTALRRKQEERWGLRNLELPLSALEETAPFRWFAAHLLSRGREFREVHNDVLREYRLVHRVRSRAHPIPELAERDGWVETPFWVWRGGDIQRGRLFARRSGARLDLARDDEPIGSLRLTAGSDAGPAVEDLADLSSRGWKLRTRALTTTLFVRVCLADLFVHGIGGAKYDEMTDRIMERFFGVAPPEFLTLTATLRLPLSPFDVTAEDERRLRARLRDLDFNADRRLAATGQITRLRRERARLIAEQTAARPQGLSRGDRRWLQPERRRRHQRLHEIGATLSSLAAEERRRTERELEQVRRQLAANRVLQSREHAWCLFPEGRLKSLLDSIRSEAGL